MTLRIPVRLFISYALVIVIGSVVAYLTIRLLAPTFFDNEWNMMARLPPGHPQGRWPGRVPRRASRRVRRAADERAVGVRFRADHRAHARNPRQRHRRRGRRRVRDPAAGPAAERGADGDAAHRGRPLRGQRPCAQGTRTGGDRQRREHARGQAGRYRERAGRGCSARSAHEMRTPLTALEGYVEGLIDGVFPRSRRSSAPPATSSAACAGWPTTCRRCRGPRSGALTCTSPTSTSPNWPAGPPAGWHRSSATATSRSRLRGPSRCPSRPTRTGSPRS